MDIKGYYMKTEVPSDSEYVEVYGLMLPQQVNVSLEPEDIRPGHRLPTIRLAYKISEVCVECVLLYISSKSGDRPITTTVFRSINVQAVGTKVLQEVYSKVAAADGASPIRRLPVGKAGQMANASSSGAVPEKELLYVALIFCAPNSSGSKRIKPAKSVMRMLGYGSQSTADKRIRAARDAGLIPPVGSSEKEFAAAFSAASHKLGKEADSE